MSQVLCIEPMKINKIPEGKESLFPSICASHEYFAQLKKDGYWYQYERQEDQCYLWSRTTSKVTGTLAEKGANVPHIMDALSHLPVGTVLIGEIYYPGKRSKDVTPIMGSLPEKAIERQEGEYGWLHYYIHDIIYYKGVNLMNYGAWVRYKILEKIWYKYLLYDYTIDSEQFLELAEIVEDDIQEACAAALAAGEEGMVLKKKTAPYTPGKRPVWDTIKIKKTDTCDAVIMGTEPATKMYDGKYDIQINFQGVDAKAWPYWIIERLEEEPWGPEWKFYQTLEPGDQTVIRGPQYRTLPVTKAYYYGWPTAIRIGAYDEQNKLVSIGTVSSGLSDTDKSQLASYVGKVCELAGMEKDPKAQTLRHFHFVRLRPDKNPQECSLDSIFG